MDSCALMSCRQTQIFPYCSHDLIQVPAMHHYHASTSIDLKWWILLQVWSPWMKNWMVLSDPKGWDMASEYCRVLGNSWLWRGLSFLCTTSCIIHLLSCDGRGGNGGSLIGRLGKDPLREQWKAWWVSLDNLLRFCSKPVGSRQLLPRWSRIDRRGLLDHQIQ